MASHNQGIDRRNNNCPLLEVGEGVSQLPGKRERGHGTGNLRESGHASHSQNTNPDRRAAAVCS
jgi:hypothetical protein